MKKILFATTALALSAGVAAAQNVTISGDARFGIQHDSGGWGPGTDKTRIEKRATFNIDAAIDSDSGVTFGARVRIRSDEGAGTAVSGARVWARAGGLTVAAGNIIGAIENFPGLYAVSVGLTGEPWSGLVTNTAAKGYFNWDAFSSRGNGAEGIEAIYSMGDFTVHASYSSDAAGNSPTPERIALWASYAFNDWTVALGVQDSDVNAEDKIVLGVAGNIGDFGIGFMAADNDGVMKYALNGSYSMGATTLSAFVAREESTGLNLSTSYGIGASYNLGGGARIVGGIQRSEFKTTRADLGVAFNF